MNLGGALMTQPQCIKIKVECCSSANINNAKRHRDWQQQLQLVNLINPTMMIEVTTFLRLETRINLESKGQCQFA